MLKQLPRLVTVLHETRIDLETDAVYGDVKIGPPTSCRAEFVALGGGRCLIIPSVEKSEGVTG